VDLQAVRLPVAQLKGKVFFLPVSLTCGNLKVGQSRLLFPTHFTGSDFAPRTCSKEAKMLLIAFAML